jgi:hypothetical protein
MNRPWTRELPTSPGIYDHRNLENAGGRVPIRERAMFVGYVNFPEDQKLGHGTKPMPLGSGKLRACRLEDPMTTESLTVQEWGGEWRRMDGLAHPPRGVQASDKGVIEDGNA